MPLSRDEQVELLTLKGLDPEKFDVDAFTGDVSPKIKIQPTLSPSTATPGKLATAGRSAALGLVPSAASIYPAIAAGSAAATWALPAAAIPVVGPFIPPTVGLATGLAVGTGVSELASAAQRWILGQSTAGQAFMDKEAAGREENPISATVGNVGSSLVGMRPNMNMLRDARSALTTEAAGGAGLLNKLANSTAVHQVALGAGLGGIGSVAEDLQSPSGDVNVTKALVNAALQGFVSDVHGGVIKPLSKYAYHGQPLGAPTVPIADSVARETVTKGVVDPAQMTPERIVERQAQLAELAKQRSELDGAKLQFQADTHAVELAELKAKYKDLKQRQAALMAETKPGPDTTQTELVASPDLQDFSAAKAAQQGKGEVVFTDKGKQTGPGTEYGRFDPNTGDIEASIHAGEITGKGKTRVATTNLPESEAGLVTGFGTPDVKQATDLPRAYTLIHEPIHKAILNITEGSPAQQRMGEKISSTIENSAEFKDWAAKTNAKDKTWDEFAARKGSVGFLADPAHTQRSWAAERKSLEALRKGTATVEDAMRILDMKFRYDSGLVVPKLTGAKLPIKNSLASDYQAELAQRDKEQASVQPDLPMNTTKTTALTDYLRKDSELPANTFEPKKGQMDLKLSEPAATDTEFDLRKETFVNERALLPAKRGVPLPLANNFGSWSETDIASFLNVDPRQVRRLKVKATAEGKTLEEFAKTYSRSAGQKVNAETGVKEALAIPGATPYASAELATSRIAERAANPGEHNLEDLKLRGQDELVYSVNDAVKRAFFSNANGAAAKMTRRAKLVGSDRNSGELPTDGDYFKNLEASVHEDLAKQGIPPGQTLEQAASNSTDKIMARHLVELDKSKSIGKAVGEDLYAEKGSRRSATSDVETTTKEDHGVTLEGDIVAEDATGHESKPTASTEAQSAGENKRRVEVTKGQSPEQIKDLKKRAIEAIRNAAEDMQTREGADLEDAAATHAKILRDIFYADPKRGSMIAEALAENHDDSAVEALVRKINNPLTKLSEPAKDDKRLFVTSLEKNFSSSKPFGLQETKAGDYVTSEILAKVKTLPAIEQELLKRAGLQDWISVQPRVSGEKLVNWLKEHGPQVDVHTYGMDGKVSAAVQETADLAHELDTLGYHVERQGQIARRGTSYTLDRDNPNVPSRAFEISDRIESLRPSVEKQKSSPRATSSYKGVSAFDTYEPMPEWTKSKEGKNVQRVDVVVPNKLTEKIPTYEEWKSMAGYDASRNEYENWVLEAKDKQIQKPALWSPDGTHEQLPNTLGWAMIQYKTGPNGEKIAVIAEAQSRWGQETRKRIASLKDSGAANPENIEGNHPLLADTNRLILKAAIEQARKEGATHVMISDAETAMMTEGHDAHATPESQYREASTIPQEGGMRHNYDASYAIADKDGVSVSDKRFTTAEDASRYAETQLRLKPASKYSKDWTGVRDESDYKIIQGDLPSIMKDITGVSGERVSLGDHKNAFKQTLEQHTGTRNIEKPELAGKDISELDAEYKLQKGWTLTGKFLLRNNEGFKPDFNIEVKMPATKYQAEQTTWINSQQDVYRSKWNTILGLDKAARSNLIFRNPDGTPKTDVSGMMYDISLPKARREAGEQMTMAERKFSEPSATDKVTRDLHERDDSKQGFFERFSPQADQVRKYNVPVADALKDTFSQISRNEGKYVFSPRIKFHEQFGNVSKHDRERMTDYGEAKYRGDKIDESAFTPEQKAGARFLNKYVYAPMRVEQNDLGMKVETREGVRRKASLSEWYSPSMMNDKTVDSLTKSENSATALDIKEKWATWIADKSSTSRSPISYDDALKEVSGYVEAMGAHGQNAPSFGAMKKSAGYGMPREMRELDGLRLAERYGRRGSRELAKFEHLQLNDFVRQKLGLEDPTTGKRTVDPEHDTLLVHEEVRHAMDMINGDYEISRSPRLLAASRVVSSGLLGLPTGLRDTATIPANALPYVKNPISGAIDIFKGLLDARKESKSALEYGARTGAHRLDTMDVIAGTDTITNAFNSAAEILRKYSGRDMLEQFNRNWTFAIGKHMADRAIREGNTSFLDKFGTIAKGEDGKWDTNQIAKNFVDRNQGTYSGQGLPKLSIDGMAAPWFALSRWSLEKSNVIWQDVIKPAYIKDSKGDRNLTPLLTYAFGAYLTGEGIESLNEMMNNDKKGSNAKWSELDAAGADKDKYVARLVNLMQLGSFAGMAGDLAKIASDVSQGESPRGYSVPAADLISTGIFQNLSNFSRAIRDGGDPLDSAGILMLEFVKNQVQMARLASNWSDDEEIARKNKFRDLRVFKKLTNQEVPSTFQASNPAFRPEERALKRATTPEEVQELLPKIVASLQEEYKDNPMMLKKAFDRLKGNSYQTFPSLKEDRSNAMAYFEYLTKAVGETEARERLEDYIRQSSFNRAKAKAAPTIHKPKQ